MRKYNLPCIECSKSDSVYILASEPGKFMCMECDAEFDIDDVKKHIEDWVAYVADYQNSEKGKENERKV